MALVVIFFSYFLYYYFFCFVVAIFNLVHNVEAIHDLHKLLSAPGI